MDRLNVLTEIAETNDDEKVVEELRKMVPTFVKPEDFNKTALEKCENEEKETDENSADNKQFQNV